MNRKLIKIVSIFTALIVVVSISYTAKQKYDRRKLEESLTGTLYYTTNHGEIVKYDISSEVKEVIINESKYFVDDCYYDKENNNIIYLTMNDESYFESILSASGNIHIDIGKFYDDILPVINLDESNGDHFSFCTLKNGFAYGIKYYYNNNGNQKPILCRIDISTMKVDFFNLDDYGEIYTTQSKRLYFNDGNGTCYLDDNDIYECPKEVKQIVAANDRYVVSYNNHRRQLKVFDAVTWEEKYSIISIIRPLCAILSPDSTKLLYCELALGYDYPDVPGRSKAVILDLENGAKIKHKIQDSTKIVRPVDWI